MSFETHRSRSFYSPWLIEPYLQAFPGLRLTADLSHWCAVSERLMTPELSPVQAIAPRVAHIHARIGHAQGPSVGHPFAPEWAEALEAHRRCWQLFASSLAAQALPLTVTPEFGPDGYLPELPFSRERWRICWRSTRPWPAGSGRGRWIRSRSHPAELQEVP